MKRLFIDLTPLGFYLVTPSPVVPLSVIGRHILSMRGKRF